MFHLFRAYFCLRQKKTFLLLDGLYRICWVLEGVMYEVPIYRKMILSPVEDPVNYENISKE